MRYFIVIYCIILSFNCFGQTDTGRFKIDAHRLRHIDTTVTRPRSATPKRDSTFQLRADSTGVVKKTLPSDTTVSNAGSINVSTSDSSAVLAGINDSLRLDTLAKDAAAKLAVRKAAVTAGMEGTPRVITGKEDVFYIFAGVFLLLGIIKVAYPRYFQNTFRFVFQTSLRQKQTPEQIVQGYVPGFLLNLLFFIVGGIAIGLYSRHALNYTFLQWPLWIIILLSAGVLAAVYMIKYLVTLFAGWVFNARQAAANYSFIVFLINRFAGIVLLPLVLLAAFYNGETQIVMFTIMAGVLVFLLLYRYLLSLTVVRKNLKMSALHFFIYLCAVELMPLLVIYKVLFSEIPSSK